MAIGHCHVTLYSRGRRRRPSKGRRANAPRKRSGAIVVKPTAAAAAYRFGLALVDPRTGVRYDHTDRDDITAGGIVAPRETPLTENLQAFVNAIERAELRRDSQLFRDLQPAVPCELVEALGKQAAAELLERFATVVSERYHTPVAWVFHPAGDGDERNGHGHLILPTRRLDEDGQLGEKIRELSTYTTSGAEVAWIKNSWRGLANEALAEAGLDVVVNVGRRLDRAPVQTLPKGVAGQERRKRRRRQRDAYRQAAGPGSEAAADAQAAEDTRAPLREQLAEDAADEQRQQLELAGLADAASPDTVARLRTPILATQAARLAGDQATAERREASTARVTARYAARARSRRERWLERQQAIQGLRPRREKSEEAPMEPGVATPEPDAPSRTPLPARKRRRRANRESDNPGTERRTKPEPDAKTQTPRPPRKRRQRAIRPGPNRLDPDAKPTTPPSTTALERQIEASLEPLGEYVIRCDAGDAPGARAAARRTSKAAPRLTRAHENVKSAATQSVAQGVRQRGIHVSRSSPPADVDRACEQWREVVRTRAGEIIADMLRAMLEAIEERLKERRNAKKQRATKRTLHLDPPRRSQRQTQPGDAPRIATPPVPSPDDEPTTHAAAVALYEEIQLYLPDLARSMVAALAGAELPVPDELQRRPWWLCEEARAAACRELRGWLRPFAASGRPDYNGARQLVESDSDLIVRSMHRAAWPMIPEGRAAGRYVAPRSYTASASSGRSTGGRGE